MDDLPPGVFRLRVDDSSLLENRFTIKPIAQRRWRRPPLRNRLRPPGGDVGGAHGAAEELNQIEVQRRHQQCRIVGRARHGVPNSKAGAGSDKQFSGDGSNAANQRGKLFSTI